MRHHEWVSRVGHSGSPPFTLGWTQFTIVLIVIAAVLLLTGAIVYPF